MIGENRSVRYVFIETLGGGLRWELERGEIRIRVEGEIVQVVTLRLQRSDSEATVESEEVEDIDSR